MTKKKTESKYLFKLVSTLSYNLTLISSLFADGIHIGSAYGKEGIWQRWVEYSKTKHGGNKTLIELCNQDSNYQNNFKYTVLQSLPSNLNKRDVIKLENLYKSKFGTKAHGLNEN